MKTIEGKNGLFVNGDCVAAARALIGDGSVDLVVADPPYGIEGDKLDRHYNRDERYVVEGYLEVPAEDYAAFSQSWIAEAARVLRPGGSIYVISGWSRLADVLNALDAAGLDQVNHVVWKYDFGVWTTKKYVSSHYHVLYYVKPGGEPTFNLECRYGRDEDEEGEGNANYRDREDVWIIGRENKPGQEKNKNELPSALLTKIIQYSSRPGDVVMDFFLGGGSTARTAIGLGRRAIGIEKSTAIFDAKAPALADLESGTLLEGLRKPLLFPMPNRGTAWTTEEEDDLVLRIETMMEGGSTKEKAVERAAEELGRGYWAIMKAIKRWEARNGRPARSTRRREESLRQTSLFGD